MVEDFLGPKYQALSVADEKGCNKLMLSLLARFKRSAMSFLYHICGEVLRCNILK